MFSATNSSLNKRIAIEQVIFNCVIINPIFADFFPKELTRQEILKIVEMLKQGIIAEMMAEKIEDVYSNWFDLNNYSFQTRNLLPYLNKFLYPQH